MALMGMPVARSRVQTVIPVQVQLLVAPPAASGAVDRGHDQAGAFVVTQGVHTDPGAASGLGDAHTRLGAGVSGHGYR
jgi:hypothetical protein